MNLGDVLELVRAPAALTVLGDTAVGRTAVGRTAVGRTAVGPTAVGRTSVGRRVGASAAPPATGGPASAGVQARLSLASALLYTAGMALNDYADADLDAVERPERPIPSGRIDRHSALRLGLGLGAAGTLCAATVSRQHGAVGAGVGAAVLSYDLWAKDTPAGPVFMALCRALDVHLGAAGQHWRLAMPASLALAAHTCALTVLSRGEVNGHPRWTAVAAAVSSVGIAAWAIAGPRPGLGGDGSARGGLGGDGGARGVLGSDGAGLLSVGIRLGAAAAFLAVVLPAQVAAAREPGAARARTATRAGIQAMIPLQALLAARAGDARTALSLGGLSLVGRLLTDPKVRAAVAQRRSRRPGQGAGRGDSDAQRRVLGDVT